MARIAFFVVVVLLLSSQILFGATQEGFSGVDSITLKLNNEDIIYLHTGIRNTTTTWTLTVNGGTDKWGYAELVRAESWSDGGTNGPPTSAKIWESPIGGVSWFSTNESGAATKDSNELNTSGTYNSTQGIVLSTPGTYKYAAYIWNEKDGVINKLWSNVVTVYVYNVTFMEHPSPNSLSGFDNWVSPPWLVVPREAPSINNNARIVTNPAATVSSVSLVCNNTNIATVSPSTPTSGDERITVTGSQKGETYIKANFNNTEVSRLNVSVKTKKTLYISFHFIQDSSGTRTARTPASVDIDQLIHDMNQIWFIQANVLLVKKNVYSSRIVATDMQDVVMWWYGIEPQHEWDDVVAMADPDADINVYFVWEYEQDYDSNTDTGGATLGTDILIEDNLSSLARNLSHEIGHSLSLADLYNAAEQPLLMYGYEDGHQKIRKSDADAANP